MNSGISLPTKLIFTLFCCGAMRFTTSGQGSILSKQIGPVLQVVRTDHGVFLQTAGVRAELSVYSSTVIRVRITRGDFAPDFSYAVVQQPGPTRWKLTESDSTVVLSTDSLVAVANRNPLRISFFTPSGRMLSGDDPALGVSWLGREVTAYRKLFPGERFIGLGEKTGNLDRRGSSYVDWNTDAYGYRTDQDPIYATMPFYIGIHDSLSYGLFFDNTYKSFFDFGVSSDNRYYLFGSADGEMNYYFFGGSNVRSILRDFTWLTGHIQMPPLWSLGYQQSRYSYMSSRELLDVATTFRRDSIPCDVVYCDIDYMDHYKVFTWNPETYPDPKAMTDSLKRMGIHLVTILDPGVKIEKGYPIYEDGIRNHEFSTYPDGTNYAGTVWPGLSYFPDFTRSETRAWWGSKFPVLTSNGVTGFWNDMDEPSPLGKGVPDLIEFGDSGSRATLAAVHNIYGLEMARATFNGAKAHLQGERPFILDRAAYCGIQRYSAMWTGDNNSTDAHMLAGVRLVNSMGIAGEAFAGMDVGGFTGNPSPQLMVRWMSLGVYTPLFRNHTAKGNTYHEPWKWGLENENLMRGFIDQRYELLPYLYSTFYEAHRTGMPVSRTLAIDYTLEDSIYNYKYQNEFMFGDALLVAPERSDQDSVRVYFPEGGWYRRSTGEHYSGGHAYWVKSPLSDLPVFVREGSIIPMQHPVQSTAQSGDGTLEIQVWKGPDSSSFLYYEDDGTSYSYQQGQYWKRLIRYDPAAKTLDLGMPEGSFPSRFSHILLVFHGFEAPVRVRELISGKAGSRPRGVSLPPVLDITHPGVWTLAVAGDREEITIQGL
ncbi:MAG TPA: glycoside hydrolase family 31 protein [Chitinophagaceae bacterium]|nr:glycoside hydrolase family 31 protein [Chitinophagaceae bacterium]